MRTCTKCKESKPESEFYFREKKGRYESSCKLCIRAFNSAYYGKNKEKVKASNAAYRARQLNYSEAYREKYRDYHTKRNRELKRMALERIGMQCACCGEADIEFLTIDHVNNDGHIHRRAINHSNMYAWLKNNDYQSDHLLQTLCFNCNFAKRYNGGVCPHRNRSETIRKEYAPSGVEAPDSRKG
jgi:hypothetical protein